MSVEAPLEWKYQRQFDSTEGVVSGGPRADLLAKRTPTLLDDEQARLFLANGYLSLQPDLPPSFHQEMFDRFAGIIGSDNDDNPGNNLLPLVPELQILFDDPVVNGALSSVLGDGYLMHPHRVLHDNAPGSDEQVWHHDSYWGYKRRVHNHHPWWVMIMYYPQDIYKEIGPTGNIPGSQYLTQRLADIEELGGHAEGPAGTCMMIHYDIWHRKMKNFTDLKRFMVKFEFIRMQRPSGVTWASEETEWRDPKHDVGFSLSPVWRSMWHWLAARPWPVLDASPDDIEAVVGRAKTGSAVARAKAISELAQAGKAGETAIPDLIEMLGDASEVVGLNAAYALAGMGTCALGPLVEAMTGDDGVNVDDARIFIDAGQKSEFEMVARNAAHGLVALGKAAVPALLICAQDGGPRVRKLACFALGELDVDDITVVETLIAGCGDEDPAVRLNAVEALGLKRGTPEAARALGLALRDEDDEVRFNASLALARLGPAAAPALGDLLGAFQDGNRYVMGYAVEAVERIGTAEAQAALIQFLKISRWCPLTSNESLF